MNTYHTQALLQSFLLPDVAKAKYVKTPDVSSFLVSKVADYYKNILENWDLQFFPHEKHIRHIAISSLYNSLM